MSNCWGVLGDAERLASWREVLILGGCNGHISELDDYTDANGKLLTTLAEHLQLEILHTTSCCEGQTTGVLGEVARLWFYALASDELVKALRRLNVDEERILSFGSDHNRIRLDFSKAQHRELGSKQRFNPNSYLPLRSLEKVVEQFERSPEKEREREDIRRVCVNTMSYHGEA
ncbi:hypothetical protein HPB51_025822 [Rhipicephalus microplus]|uniref:Tick transposon n=1 Tax=Rhipicephalus microplus TaxID=6941 RepID=A0A9J6EJP6_RHIMP|nr:hypothetical protein HPB51_025822 [Rhipicephalus microplus]